MSLSDCPKCWDTPCTCGHGYSDWTIEQLESQIRMLERVKHDRLETDRTAATKVPSSPRQVPSP